MLTFIQVLDPSKKGEMAMMYEGLEDKIVQIKSLYEKYRDNRPEPERNLDQFWATEETVARRALLLGNLPNISEKKILFLGDDDLTSLAFCRLFKAKAVTVVDIDKRLVDFLVKIAETEGFPIEVVEHDLRSPLPKDKFRDYDVVFFDPPYTPEAANAWLARAIESSLGKGRVKIRKSPDVLTTKTYLMCYGYSNRSTERGLKIQQIITSLGLVIQEKIRGFNNYYGVESLDSSSDLYTLQPTPIVNIRRLEIARSHFYTGRKMKQ